ncbi:DnaK family protein [Besnoitia besnoiti]|uniref:DnaK family protein n=1 Tax=Besnoitia besnoiti TaxID=94643 RepID=A0A2A9MMA9_BESBE|nr:DnaK family protein [Besnoitia besnoiti]PFH37541.1 DnaK family protein [Besnoitia besnoiti]
MAVIGIDLGSLNSVMATIQRGTVSVVTTELSDRVTPSLVGFTDDQRLLGDHALAQMKSNAKNTCRYFRNVLGEIYDPSSSHLKKEFDLSLQNMTPLPPNNIMGYRVHYRGQEMEISAERVAAAFLTKLRQVAESSLQKAVSEVVIACPPWFRDANRSALLDAAQIAGLKCLRVISDMAATCLDYGMYRRQHFAADRPHIVAFVGVGHSCASACIAAFWADRMRILAEVSDPELGGRDMDYEIVRHFATAFENKTKLNPLASLKARLKLEDQANKAKKILSANSETSFHVECLMEDEDCSGLLTRDAFEELCAQRLVPRLEALLQAALDKSGLKKEDLMSVEIVGGGTRIPWVQRCITNTYGLELSRTLAADETVARGCALQAAMASSSFKVKEYGFGERTLHPICLTWAEGEQPVAVQPLSSSGHPLQDSAEVAGGVETIQGQAPSGEPCILIPAGSDTNTIRKITFLRNGPFTLKAQYADLPAGSPAAQLDACHVSLTPAAEPQEIQIFVHLNYCGLLRFARVCVKQKREEEEVVQKDAATSASSPAGAEGAAAAEAEKMRQTEVRRVVRTVKIDVPYQVQEAPSRPTTLQLRDFREDELNMDNEDRMTRDKMDKLNELESYLYTLRDDIDDRLREFAAADERDRIQAQLEATQTWLDDVFCDTKSVAKSAVVTKLEELHEMGDRVTRRFEEFNQRKEAEQLLHTAVSESRLAAQSHDEAYAHIPTEEKRKVMEMADETEAWLSEMMAKQNGMALYLDPILTVKEMHKKRDALMRFSHKVFATPKPKPAPPQEPAGSQQDVDMSAGEEKAGGEQSDAAPPQGGESEAAQHPPQPAA